MDCRRSVLIPLLALAICPAGVPAHAGQAPVAIEVRGDDFPALVQSTGLPPPLDESGLPQAPGCESVRARRIDELPHPWRAAVDRIHLDCQPLDPADAGQGLALTTTAFLKPGRVWLAGHAVAEIRLMDSDLWGDHQYVLAAAYDEVAADLRRQVEADCASRHLREERGEPEDCRMLDSGGELYLQVDEINGIWIHPDADDAGLTVYAEGWAD